MMNIVIDSGNSYFKIGVFDIDQKLHSCSGTDIVELLSETIPLFPDISHGIVSSVGNFRFDSLLNQYQCISWLKFSHETAIQLTNKYTTPASLGLDRIAASVGASSMFPTYNILVIDAGTAITYEYITATGEYLGGNISPGMKMRYRSLHTFTAQLPLLEAGAPNLLLGCDTVSAIQLGVERGIQYELDGAIQHFERNFQDGKIVITGGDAKYFEKKLNNRIFAEPDLVLIGLNNILNYNIENTLF
jgi:type III pantothenate kinase